MRAKGSATRGNIVACSDVIDGVNYRPQTLAEVGFERITGRKVTGWSASLGSYGMGGPGFFGLNLAGKGEYPDEWLVLRVWGAGCWLCWTAGGSEAHPNQYHVQEPLYSNFGPGEDWDRVTDKVVGATLRSAVVEDGSLGILSGRRWDRTGWKCPKMHHCYPCMAGQCSPACGMLTKISLTRGLFLMATCGCRGPTRPAVTCAF